VELEAAACALIDSFPAEFRDSFRVYDFGFYLHQEVTEGGYPEPFVKKIQEVQGLSPYYLLFGKQTDRNGVYTRFWVVLKMPSSAQFSCMTALHREVYSKRVQKKTNDKYNEDTKTPLAYYVAEIAGIMELQKIIYEIKECCIVVDRNGIAQRSAGCDGCSDEIANSYFELADFREIDLAVTVTDFATINTSKIKDVSNCKFSKNDQLVYLGTHLSDFVADINDKNSFNLIVTSNQSLCTNPIQDLEDFSRQQEFNCWIDFGMQNSGTASSYIKVVWNQDKAQCIKDPKLAQKVIKDLYCYIYSELSVFNGECSVVIPPSPPPTCSFDIPITSNNPSGGLTITQFIQLVRNEEAKYTQTEQEDTKAMITRFRKVFYGSPAWDKNLIPDAATIPCIKPYIIKNSENSRKYVHSIPAFEMVDKGYYPVDPTNNNQRPPINYVTNPSDGTPQTQEIRLEVGTHANYLIDIGHTLCGMDAFNNARVFTFTIKDVPISTFSIDRNIDAVTWLGDLASAQAEIVVANINESAQYPNEQQALINHYASAPDMLGDIDGVVIGMIYPTSGIKKVSDILEHYYLGAGITLYQEKRYSLFSQNLGLIWDSGQQKFTNLEEKTKFYNDQTNDAAAYYVAGAALEAGLTSIPGGCFIATAISLNPLSNELLRCFFNKLEEKIKLEP